MKRLNPIAKAVRTPAYRAKTKPSGKVYKRRPKHRRDQDA
jgi:hypothetical protein